MLRGGEFSIWRLAIWAMVRCNGLMVLHLVGWTGYIEVLDFGVMELMAATKLEGVMVLIVGGTVIMAIVLGGVWVDYDIVSIYL